MRVSVRSSERYAHPCTGTALALYTMGHREMRVSQRCTRLGSAAEDSWCQYLNTTSVSACGGGEGVARGVGSPAPAAQLGARSPNSRHSCWMRHRATRMGRWVDQMKRNEAGDRLSFVEITSAKQGDVPRPRGNQLTAVMCSGVWRDITMNRLLEPSWTLLEATLARGKNVKGTS